MIIISKRARRVNPILLENVSDDDDDDVSEYGGGGGGGKKVSTNAANATKGRSVKHSLSACKFCKSKKIKCSGDLPCERCKRMGIECVYLKTSRYFTSRKKKNSSGDSSEGNDNNSSTGDITTPVGQNTTFAFPAPSSASALSVPSSSASSASSSSVASSISSSPVKRSSSSRAAVIARGGKIKVKQEVTDEETSSRFSFEDEEDELQLTTVSGVQQQQFYPSLSSGNVIFGEKAPVFEYREGSNQSTSSAPSYGHNRRRRRPDDDGDELQDNSPSSDGSSSASSSSPSQSLLCARQGFSEMMMADTASATFLMDVFVSKVLPHFSTLKPKDVLASLDNPRSVADQMRRDGALAFACRNCGHDGLANLLRERMERCSEVVAQLWGTSEEGANCFNILHALLATESLQKSMAVAQTMFRIYRASLPPAQANMDPVEALCQPLQTLNLSGDPMPRDVTPAEVEALVRHSAEQMVLGSQTMEDLRLRAFLGYCVNLRLGMTAPGLRPASVLVTMIVVDLQLLGLLVPPYLMEALSRHDPHGSFGIGAFFKPGVPLDALMDPIALPKELGELFLRRIGILRALFLLSPFHPAVIPPSMVAVEGVDAVANLRMGNIDRAMELAWGIIHLVEHHDMNFWPPMIPQFVFLMSSVFYEAGSAEGIDQVILMLMRIQRSTPYVKYAVNALLELRQRVADRLKNAPTVAPSTTTATSEPPAVFSSDPHLSSSFLASAPTEQFPTAPVAAAAAVAAPPPPPQELFSSSFAESAPSQTSSLLHCSSFPTSGCEENHPVIPSMDSFFDHGDHFPDVDFSSHLMDFST